MIYTRSHTNTVEHTLTHMALQWSLSITETLGPCHFLLQYRGFPLSAVKNVLVTPVGTRILPSLLRFFLFALVCQEANIHYLDAIHQYFLHKISK